MIEPITLPEGLIRAIGSESKDFAVKAGRAHPFKASIFLILFGLVWLGFTSIFFFAFLGPLFQGEEVHFLANDVPVTAGPGNLKEIRLPAIIIGVFTLVGMGLLYGGLYMFFKPGGYFVGTPTRLINFYKNGFRSIDWEQFSGDIDVKGNERRGTITLGMRTGRMQSQKSGPDRYVPDTLYLSDIPNVFEVEKICRKRIKENDPTPVRV